MNFCLSDLVPPLRWSDAAAILAGRAGLPDAWWRSLPMSRVLAALGSRRARRAPHRSDARPLARRVRGRRAARPARARRRGRRRPPGGHRARPGRVVGGAAGADRAGADRAAVRERARPLITALYSAVLTKLAGGETAAAKPSFIRQRPPSRRRKLPPRRPYETKAALEDALRAQAETKARLNGNFAGALRGQGPRREARRSRSAEAPPLEGRRAEDRPPRPRRSPSRAAPARTTDLDLADVIDRVFASLDDQSWMVAQNRVFTDSPTSPESLSKLLGVPARSRSRRPRTRLRSRLRDWVASPVGRPLPRLPAQPDRPPGRRRAQVAAGERRRVAHPGAALPRRAGVAVRAGHAARLSGLGRLDRPGRPGRAARPHARPDRERRPAADRLAGPRTRLHARHPPRGRQGVAGERARSCGYRVRTARHRHRLRPRPAGLRPGRRVPRRSAASASPTGAGGCGSTSTPAIWPGPPSRCPRASPFIWGCRRVAKERCAAPPETSR